MWKWVVGVLVVLGVLGGAAATAVLSLGGIDGVVARFRPQTRPLEVRIETVRRGELVRTVNAPGELEPRTSVDIGARVSARIVELPRREGDDVRQGEVLFRLDDEDLRARLDAARSRLEADLANLEGARATLALAEIEYGRQKELYETRDVPRSALDAAEAEYRRSLATVRALENSVEATRAEIAERRKDLENTVVVAPMDGTILTLNSELGELVLGTRDNMGTVVMVLADLTDMLMRARVDETNVAPVRAGQHATIYLNAYPDRTFQGTVERVKLRREEARDGTSYVEAEIRVHLAEGERLYSKLTGNVDIEVERLPDVIKVPSQAVLDRRVEDLPPEIRDTSEALNRDKSYARVVYRVVDGRTVVTPVEVGSSDLTHTVVRAGLTEGDRIVTGPYKVLLTLDHDQVVTEAAAAEPVVPVASQDGATGATAGG